VPFSEKVAATGAGENRKTIETEILSNKYMTKKLKLLSLAAFVAVAAVTASQAATASYTITNVIQTVNAPLTIYPSNSVTANTKDNVLTAKVKAASLSTKSVLAAISSATGIPVGPAAKLVLLTQYQGSNIYSYPVTYTVCTNRNVLTTNMLTTFDYNDFTNNYQGY